MKLQFEDSFTNDRVAYQRCAIKAVPDVFHGQKIERTEFTVVRPTPTGPHHLGRRRLSVAWDGRDTGNNLGDCRSLGAETATLRVPALTERQIVRKAELNLEGRRVAQRIAELRMPLG